MSETNGAPRTPLKRATDAIERTDRMARDEFGEKVPPQTAPADELADGSTAEVTVNVQWLAYLIVWSARRSEATEQVDNVLATYRGQGTRNRLSVELMDALDALRVAVEGK